REKALGRRAAPRFGNQRHGKTNAGTSHCRQSKELPARISRAVAIRGIGASRQAWLREAGRLRPVPTQLPREPHREQDESLQNRTLRDRQQPFCPLRRGTMPARQPWFGNDLLQLVQPALRLLPELRN